VQIYFIKPRVGVTGAFALGKAMQLFTQKRKENTYERLLTFEGNFSTLLAFGLYAKKLSKEAMMAAVHTVQISHPPQRDFQLRCCAGDA
jgi:hypothetical protein